VRATDLTDLAGALIASAAYLALTVLAAARGRRDPLARNLAVLCVDLFVYCMSETMRDLKAQQFWAWINDATASLSLVLFYHLVVVFVGRRKAMRWMTRAMYVYFVTLALMSLSPVFGVGVRVDRVLGESWWAIAMLFGLVTVIGHGVVLLAKHLRGASAEETSRSRLLLAAALIAGAANATDLFDIAGASWSPHLGSLGLVVSALLLMVAALRIGMFERLSILTAVNTLAIAFMVVLAEFAVFRLAGDRPALAVVSTVFVTLGALLATRFVVNDYVASRERTLAHATLGRMAAQMAHDIKNPLASIRGAAQFLAQERASGRSIDEQQEFLDLLVAQCDRLTRIVDQYQRIGRAEPVLGSTDLNDAVREAIKFLGSAVTLDEHLTDPLPPCETDRDLLVIALENVLRNAHEARVDGAIHLSTGVVTSDRESFSPSSASPRVARWVFVAVRDDGPGMDPRTRERALEGFFTTKSHGSGLGLAFVRRVIEAHGGKLIIDSQEGSGTTVRIELRTSGSV